MEERLRDFTDKEKLMIEHNQENRKSFVFSSLLKLQKFGDLKDFVDSLNKGFKALKTTEVQLPEPPVSIQANIHYSDIARKTDKAKTGFTIKLMDCDN